MTTTHDAAARQAALREAELREADEALRTAITAAADAVLRIDHAAWFHEKALAAAAREEAKAQQAPDAETRAGDLRAAREAETRAAEALRTLRAAADDARARAAVADHAYLAAREAAARDDADGSDL
jgi:hypothetical protein